jgi:hypothetical protein
VNQRLRVLQDLGAQVERLAAPAPPARPPARRRRAIAAAVALALLAAAAAALAATGLLRTGAPVRPGLGDLTDPATGPGAVRPGSVTGILAHTPDPAGGPPWGIRVVGTTRGLACLQVGRVVRGRLGVLGQDGLFADDGRFHPLPAAVTTPSAGCIAPDADGRLFAAISYSGLPASGYALRLTGSRTLAPPGGCADANLTRRPAVRRCPDGDERALYFGMLGPRAAKVTYAAAGRTRTSPTGRGGAYVIALGPPATDGLTASLTPQPGRGQPIRRITYRDGSSCLIPVRAAGRPCPPVGFRPIGLPRPSLVAARLHVVHSIQPGRSPVDRLTVDFTARVPIRGAGAAYVLVLARPVLGGCVAGGTIATSTAADVAPGARVTLELDGPSLGPCPGGVYTGTVYYVLNPGNGTPPGLIPPGPAGRDVTVGRFSFTEP